MVSQGMTLKVVLCLSHIFRHISTHTCTHMHTRAHTPCPQPKYAYSLQLVSILGCGGQGRGQELYKSHTHFQNRIFVPRIQIWFLALGTSWASVLLCGPTGLSINDKRKCRGLRVTNPEVAVESNGGDLSLGDRLGLYPCLLFPYPVGREGGFSPVDTHRTWRKSEPLSPRTLPALWSKAVTSPRLKFVCITLPEEETTTASAPMTVPDPQYVILVGWKQGIKNCA